MCTPWLVLGFDDDIILSICTTRQTMRTMMFAVSITPPPPTHTLLRTADSPNTRSIIADTWSRASPSSTSTPQRRRQVLCACAAHSNSPPSSTFVVSCSPSTPTRCSAAPRTRASRPGPAFGSRPRRPTSNSGRCSEGWRRCGKKKGFSVGTGKRHHGEQSVGLFERAQN
jgi:hypothetical protein